MTVKIDFEQSDIEPAIQRHLDGGGGVRDYIVAAVRYFNAARKAEENGSMMGYGNPDRFKTYNTELSTSTYLAGDDD